MLMTATASCPIEGLVAARLGPNVPFRYQVELNGPTLAIRFFDEERPVERSFAAAPSCDENVKVASAVLSAWMISPPVQRPAPSRTTQPSPPDAEANKRSPAPSPNSSSRPRARGLAVAEAARAPIQPSREFTEAPAEPSTPPIPALRSPNEAAPTSAPRDLERAVVTPAIPEPRSRNEAAPPPAAPRDLERAAVTPAIPEPRSRNEAAPPPSAPRDHLPMEPTPKERAAGVPTARDEVSSPVASNALSVSIEGGASASGGSAIAIAAAGAARLTYGSTVAGYLELDGTTPRTFSLGVGQVSWARLSGGVGARLRVLETARFSLEPGLSLQLAALPVSGSGFRSSASALVPDLGGCANLRAGLRATGDLELFLALRACAWPVTPNVRVAGIDLTAALPSADASVRLGVSYGWKL